MEAPSKSKPLSYIVFGYASACVVMHLKHFEHSITAMQSGLQWFGIGERTNIKFKFIVVHKMSEHQRNKLFRIIVTVNSRILQRPLKRSRGNQLVHRRLTKTKSIDSGPDPESQTGRQTVRWLWWMVFGVEMEWAVGKRE